MGTINIDPFPVQDSYKALGMWFLGAGVLSLVLKSPWPLVGVVGLTVVAFDPNPTRMM